jgi:2'-5' RNA ligase
VGNKKNIWYTISKDEGGRIMKYGIAIFPSKNLQDKVNSYRKRYDPHYALIAPHITLKEPFEATEEELQDQISYISSVAQNINPFSIKINKVGSFHPVNNAIYLKVNEAEELKSLHDQLYSGPLDHQQPYNFVPHLTLGQKLSDEEHSDVLERLRMIDIEHEERIDRFQLLYQLENGYWTVYETFRLGKGV